MLARATALLPPDTRNHGMAEPALALALVGGPRQSILRPVDLEDGPLRRHLHQVARFGPTPIFVDEQGATGAIDGHAFTLSQTDRSIRLDEEGAIRLTLPLSEGRDGITAIIEEDVRTTLLTALRFGSALLDHIDPVHRLSHLAVAARITDSGGRSWRTRREHAASPNQGSWGMNANDHPAVSLSPPSRPRAVFSQQADELAEDLTVLLRRQQNSAH